MFTEEINLDNLMTYPAFTLYTNIWTLIVASRTINNLLFMPVIKSFSYWHAVQLALVGSFCVRHPSMDEVDYKLVTENMNTHKDVTLLFFITRVRIYIKYGYENDLWNN